MFSIKNKALVKNKKPHLIVVITKPAIKYDLFLSPLIENKKKYCFYQMIKYSNWSNQNRDLLLDKDNSIHIWENFYQNAPLEIKNSIQ